jgi:hypothetical protein
MSPMIFVALVTFEHGSDAGHHLPLNYQGACGWIAIDATDENDARTRLRSSLEAEGLTLVELERLHRVNGAMDVDALDGHLAANMREWEPGRPTVWGTIHCYAGDRSN